LDREEKALREAIVEKCRWMNAIGLNQGTSGNISARYGDRMLITPSSIPYDIMTGAMIASMPIDGEYGAWEGRHRPSTEWRFHLDIMKDRPDVGAIVHTHATYATILSIARRSIPSCHYMVAVFGGTDIRCAEYATYGTKALAENAVKALKDRNGCLLANHGMIAAGDNLDKAMWLAVELETIAKQYFNTLLIGGPVILPPSAIEETRVSMKQQKEGYGLTDLKQIRARSRRPATKKKAPRR
jgi:L-fuculose-phosphate aldolase